MASFPAAVPTAAAVPVFASSSSLTSSSPSRGSHSSSTRSSPSGQFRFPYIDPSHPNAHLLSSLAASAVPAMSFAAPAMVPGFDPSLFLSHPSGPFSSAPNADLMALMAAYYQQLQLMMMGYQHAAMTAALPSLPSLPSFPSPSLSIPHTAAAAAPPSDDPDHLDFAQGVVRCICGQFHRDPPLLRCSACGVLQHPACMGHCATGDTDEEYNCELCEPTAPVHVGREMVLRRKEAQWKELVRRRGTPSPASSEGKRKRAQGQGGRKRPRAEEKGMAKEEEAAEGAVSEEEEVLQQLQAMFRCEIDDDLFDPEPSDAVEDLPPLAETVPVETKDGQGETETTKGWEREEANGAADDDSDEEDDEPPPPRVLTASEKDAAAAISLLSPRGPALGRGRLAVSADPLMSLTPHRTASSPSSSSALFASIAFASPRGRGLEWGVRRPGLGGHRGAVSLPSSPAQRAGARRASTAASSPKGGPVGAFSMSLQKALGGVMGRGARVGGKGREGGEGAGAGEEGGKGPLVPAV